MPKAAFPITGDPKSDQLLTSNPLALVLGMMLDQQVPMEWAFRGPATLQERLGGDLDAARIAEMDPSKLEEVFREKPALHRYPGSMAKRAHALCTKIVDEYDGDAAKIWRRARSAEVVYDRLRDLPGFGEEKSKIFVAILVKRFSRNLAGWEEVTAPFSDDTPRSAADVGSAESLLAVRDFKKAMKAKGKGKTG